MRPFTRAITPLAFVAAIFCVTAFNSAGGQSGNTSAITSSGGSCPNTNTLPVATCTSVMTGASETATASATASNVSATGGVSGTTAAPVPNGNNVGGSAVSNYQDALTFSGTTLPTQVFVDFLGAYDASATAGNAGTVATSWGRVYLEYAGQQEQGSVYCHTNTDPVCQSSLNSNTGVDLASVGGGLTRATFTYDPSSDYFLIYTDAYGFLYPSGYMESDVLSGNTSGSASLQLVNIIGADANGTPIEGLTCSFQSGNPCGLNLNEVTATPEPASLVLVGTGLLGVFGAVRRRRFS